MNNYQIEHPNFNPRIQHNRDQFLSHLLVSSPKHKFGACDQSMSGIRHHHGQQFALNMGCIATKPVFGVSDKVILQRQARNLACRMSRHYNFR